MIRTPRRWLFAIVAIAAVVAPSACGSDQATDDVKVVAFLRALTTNLPGIEEAFLDELRQTGFVRGQNLRLIAGNPEEIHPDPDEARAVVAGWRDSGVDLIFAGSSSAAQIAREVAPDIDVLFISNDPVAVGLVDDEEVPGGRLTGLAYRVPVDRLLDVARRIVPELTTVGVAHPDDPAGLANLRMLVAGAEALDIGLIGVPFDDAAGLEAAVAELGTAGIDVLVMSSSPIAVAAFEETRLAAEVHGLPVIATSPRAEFALVTLYPAADEIGRQLGRQASRLLLGESPASVPVETPRRFVLSVNAAVAERFGFEIPEDVIIEAQVVAS